jgi:hypothetical protein
LRNSRYFYVATTSYASGPHIRETSEEQEEKLKKAIQKDLGLQVIFDCDPPQFESFPLLPKQHNVLKGCKVGSKLDRGGNEGLEEHVGIFSFSIQQAVLFLFYHFCLLYHRFQVLAPIPSWLATNNIAIHGQQRQASCHEDSSSAIELTSGSFVTASHSSSLLSNAMADNYYGLQFVAKMTKRDKSSFEGLVLYSFERCVLTTTCKYSLLSPSTFIIHCQSVNIFFLRFS